MLAACLSLLVASVIATANHLHQSTSEKVWHLGGYVVQIPLERQTIDAIQAKCTYSSIYIKKLQSLLITKTLLKPINSFYILMNPAVLFTGCMRQKWICNLGLTVRDEAWYFDFFDFRRPEQYHCLNIIHCTAVLIIQILK